MLTCTNRRNADQNGASVGQWPAARHWKWGYVSASTISELQRNLFSPATIELKQATYIAMFGYVLSSYSATRLRRRLRRRGCPDQPPRRAPTAPPPTCTPPPQSRPRGGLSRRPFQKKRSGGHTSMGARPGPGEPRQITELLNTTII